jgi:hypothetical protein
VNPRPASVAREKEIQMFGLRSHPRRALALALAVAIAAPPAALAQSTALQATKPADASVMQKIELLFVQNSTGMQYDKAKGVLRLKNIAASTLFFTDRPVRMAGHYHTRDEFMPLWSEGPDSFAKNPPNATLSILEVGNPDLVNAVVTLRNPRMHGNDLVYDIKVVEGTVPQSAGAAVLFIDVFGVWRRHARRWAVVGTTAAVATAGAASAAAASEAAAARAAAPPPPPPAPATVNVQVTAPAPKPAAPAASPAAAKLEQLKQLLSEGLITQAQYQKASTQVLNEMVQ